MIAPDGRADARVFLARLLRMDPAAVVRLRPGAVAAGQVGTAELWAMLPFRVLVTRGVAATVSRDTTVAAAELLAWLDRPETPPPATRDSAWGWPLPPRSAPVVERLDAADVRQVAAAASQTLRVASAEGIGGRPTGERALREALLDHVPITVTGPGGERVDVPQRLVQGLVQMNFLGNKRDGFVTVRAVAAWIGLVAAYGSVWHRIVSPLRLN